MMPVKKGTGKFTLKPKKMAGKKSKYIVKK